MGCRVSKSERPFSPTIDDISKQANIHPSIAEHVIAGLIIKGLLLKFVIEGKDIIVHRDVITSLKKEIVSILRVFHKENPLKTGIEETHLKTLVAAGFTPAPKTRKARVEEPHQKTFLGKGIHPLLLTAALSVLKNEKAVKVTRQQAIAHGL